jgi:hypothetical protein
LYIIRPRKKILVFVYNKTNEKDTGFVYKKAKGINYWFLYIIRPREKILVFVFNKAKGIK